MNCPEFFKKQACMSLAVFVVWHLLLFSRGFSQDIPQIDRSKQMETAGQYFESGRHYFANKDFHRARENLEKCLQIHPRHGQAHFFLSQTFYEVEDFYKALIHIRKAKDQLAPDIPADYYFFHGHILYKLKRYPEARKQYQMAFRLTCPLKKLISEKRDGENLK